MNAKLNFLYTQLIKFRIYRTLRDLRELTLYPLWLLHGKPAPDNHIYKRKRILSIGKRYSCDTFIETGTFYGQTVNAVKGHFSKVLSVELFDMLYESNKAVFAHTPNVCIYHGDSSSELKKMMQHSTGRILFWLDGHYSGEGTACGTIESPIISELELIKQEHRNDHCILIDDVRLFTGQGGYPTIEVAKKKLLEINPKYQVMIDHDCIAALP